MEGPLGSAEMPEEPTGEFPVEFPGYRGTLSELLRQVRRGEIDTGQLPISTLTSHFRERQAAGELTTEEIARVLPDLARLLQMKATTIVDRDLVEEAIALDERQALKDEALRVEREREAQRQRDYRMFKKVADQMAQTDLGASFRAVTMPPQVVPRKKVTVSTDRLAAAFQRIVERIPKPVTLELAKPVDPMEQMARLRRWLRKRRSLTFAGLFRKLQDQPTAIAMFLGLLEMVRREEVEIVEHPGTDELEIHLLKEVRRGPGGRARQAEDQEDQEQIRRLA